MDSLIKLNGKKGIILGIANEKSIAWGIAEKLSQCGADLAFSYVNDSIKKRVLPLAEKCKSQIVLECDVTSDSSIDNFFKELSKIWESFDFLVCTPTWFAENQVKDRFAFGRHSHFVPEYNYELLFKCIHDLSLNTNGESWGEVATKISRYGHWEFEDY